MNKIDTMYGKRVEVLEQILVGFSSTTCSSTSYDAKLMPGSRDCAGRQGDRGNSSTTDNRAYESLVLFSKGDRPPSQQSLQQYYYTSAYEDNNLKSEGSSMFLFVLEAGGLEDTRWTRVDIY